MSISIIKKKSTGRPYNCVVCKKIMPDGRPCIKDLQTTGQNGKKYYHPECFAESRPEKTIEIWSFWNDLARELPYQPD